MSKRKGQVLVGKPIRPSAKLLGRIPTQVLQNTLGAVSSPESRDRGGERWRGYCTRAAFLSGLERQERGAGRAYWRRNREDAFVLTLWRNIRVQLNCQLMRFLNHVLPFKSRPPSDLIPRQQQGAKPPPASLKTREFPELVQEGWESFLGGEF